LELDATTSLLKILSTGQAFVLGTTTTAT